MKKILTIIFLFSIITFVWISQPNITYACHGDASCCTSQSISCSPLGCTEGQAGCTCTTTCNSTTNFPCSSGGDQCNMYIPVQCIINTINGNACVVHGTAPPAPTATPAGTPPPGSCTSGDPFYGIPNCGSVGRVNGSGSCGAGCLCCSVSNPGPNVTCSITVKRGSSTGTIINNGETYNINTSTTNQITAQAQSNGWIEDIIFTDSTPTTAYLSPYDSGFTNGARKTRVYCQDRGLKSSAQYNVNYSGACSGEQVITGIGGGPIQNITSLANPGGPIPMSVVTTCQNEQGETSRSVNFYVNVINVPAWWQVKGGDVLSGGNLTSLIPSSGSFNRNFIQDLPTQGTGYPGVAIYNNDYNYDFEAGSGQGLTSSKGWLAGTKYTGKSYDFGYFETLVPSDVSFVNLTGSVSGGSFISMGTPNKGYVWFRSNGDLIINSPANLGSRKVILLVDGNLTIGDTGGGGGVSVNDGSGFFMAVVSGNINIHPAVSGTPSIEALLLSDGVISTGTGNSALYIRGSVIANGGLNLQRDLGNTNNQTNPAEVFEYAPDMILNFPRSLARSRIIWQEVAP